MLVKTHLIVTDQWDDYSIKWVRRLIDTNPVLDNYGYPTFVVISGGCGRVEIKTLNIFEVEKHAKRLTLPMGRGSLTTDTARIYIKEDKQEVLIGYVVQNHFRKYAPMYDEL